VHKNEQNLMVPGRAPNRKAITLAVPSPYISDEPGLTIGLKRLQHKAVEGHLQSFEGSSGHDEKITAASLAPTGNQKVAGRSQTFLLANLQDHSYTPAVYADTLGPEFGYGTTG